MSRKQLEDAILVNLYTKQDLTVKEIGARFGYSESWIQKRLRALGVNGRPKQRIEIDAAILRNLREEFGMPIKDIAAKFGVSKSKIEHEISVNQIRFRNAFSHVASRHGRDAIEAIYAAEGSQVRAAAKLGIAVSLFSKLVNHYGITLHEDRRRSDKRFLIDANQLRRLYVIDGRTMESIASMYGCSRPVISRKLKALGLSRPSRRNVGRME
jgi:transcriptional regulator with XRE-family HTH domain